MTQYRVVWWQRPHNHHNPRVLIVEATDPIAAGDVARDHVEQTLGLGSITIYDVSVYTRPSGGHVIQAQP